MRPLTILAAIAATTAIATPVGVTVRDTLAEVAQRIQIAK